MTEGGYTSNTEKDLSGKQLFSSIQIGLACFFATPFASLLMLGMNFKIAEDKKQFRIALLIAFLFLPILLYLVTTVLNNQYYRILIFIVAAIMSLIADAWQKDLYTQHKNAGGKIKSFWHVFLVIIASLTIIFFGYIIFALITGKTI